MLPVRFLFSAGQAPAGTTRAKIPRSACAAPNLTKNNPCAPSLPAGAL